MSSFFFFNDTATTEIYTLSLHDALPICATGGGSRRHLGPARRAVGGQHRAGAQRQHDVADDRAHRLGLQEKTLGDRKSTRLNSSHANISYAVFCLKKKKQQSNETPPTRI